MTEAQGTEIIENLATIVYYGQMVEWISWGILDTLSTFLGVVIGMGIIWSVFYRGSPVSV